MVAITLSNYYLRHWCSVSEGAYAHYFANTSCEFNRAEFILPVLFLGGTFPPLLIITPNCEEQQMLYK